MRPITHIIKTEEEYNLLLNELNNLLQRNPDVDSPAADRIGLLSLLIADYEDMHYPIDLPSARAAIKFRMEQMGLAPKDLMPYIGSRSRVSEILNGKRPLSLRMIRALHKGLGIPADVLIQD